MLGELFVEGLIFADGCVEEVTGVSPAAAVLTAGVVTAGIVGAVGVALLEEDEDSKSTSVFACDRCGKQSVHTQEDGWHIFRCSAEDCNGWHRVRDIKHEKWNQPPRYKKPTEIRKPTIKERILEAISDYFITIPSVEKHRCERVGHEYVGRTGLIYKYPVKFDKDGEFAYLIQLCSHKCDNCNTWHDLDGTEEVIKEDMKHESEIAKDTWKKLVNTGFVDYRG